MDNHKKMQEQGSLGQNNQGFKKGFVADKTIGYVLLVTGLLMIVVPVFLIISVLTGRSKPPQVLNVEAPSIQLPGAGSIELPEQLRAQGFSLGQAGKEQSSQKIISDEVFSFYINAGVFYLLMMFIASAGSKIATVGVHLIKDIKVKS